MKIAFDGTVLHGRKSGVGYYCEELLNAMLDMDHDDRGLRRNFRCRLCPSGQMAFVAHAWPAHEGVARYRKPAGRHASGDSGLNPRKDRGVPRPFFWPGPDRRRRHQATRRSRTQLHTGF